jgi:serine/threonine protein kinase
VKKPTPFGKYYLLERINVGGMAEVFRAKAFGVEGFERLVAVKRILPSVAEDREFIRMFIEEAKLAVQLNHANIAQIFDLGVVDGSYYIALEHVHGRDLRGMFDRARHLGEVMPIAQACFIAMKLCEGLDYAHNKRDQVGRELGLVHGDVSPQNVLVSFEGEIKLIDFGIAKAIGRGGAATADGGVLKGKLGYMSPEQVLGLAVDRRSDVFACGIVLYELLTGERLFVGESDFSILEKVRSVDVVAPSTYNRKIPAELERIVLKALARDADERYASAIDLHDELQAFVYTAGEFYSRKDLAAWMKRAFGREIEDETAKLESYRQLRPPPAEPRPLPPAVPTPPTRRATQAPPPPPPPIPRAAPPRLGPSIAPPVLPPMAPTLVPTAMEPPASAGPPVMTPPRGRAGSSGWDEDDVETRVYDHPEAPAPGAHGGRFPGSPYGQAPDLSSLASTAKGWDLAQGPRGGGGGGAQLDRAAGSDRVRAPLMLEPSARLTVPREAELEADAWADGAGAAGAPVPSLSERYAAPDASGRPLAVSAVDTYGAGYGARAAEGSRLAARGGGIDARADGLASRPSFGSSFLQRRATRQSTALVLLVGAAAVAAVTAAIVIVVTGAVGSSGRVGAAGGGSAVGSAAPGSGAGSALPAAVLQATGFDLYVAPTGVLQWKLDGETRTDRLPSRIRGIAPGVHSVHIVAPPGFVSQTVQVPVVAGKADRVDVRLEPMAGISGLFLSDPPGATVTLIADGNRQALGPSPVRAPLDPRLSYQVLFERPGYVSVNRPIVLTGALEEKLVIALEPVGAVAIPSADPPKAPPAVAVVKRDPPRADPPRPPRAPPRVTPPAVAKVDPPTPDPPSADPPPADPPKVSSPPEVPKAGVGTLALGSKPSCEIYVDGASTGLYTPQPAMKLPAGKRRITLINNEYGISESFFVEISPDRPTKLIKDFSDRLAP